MFLMNVFLAFLCAVFKVREVPSGLSFRTAAGIPQNDIAEEKGISLAFCIDRAAPPSGFALRPSTLDAATVSCARSP